MKTVFSLGAVTLLLSSSALSTVGAEEKIELTKAQPPIYVVARLNSKGKLEVERVVTVPRVEKRTRIRIKNGKKVTDNYEKYVAVREKITLLLSLSDVEIYRGANEKLEAEDIRDEFQKPKAVLMTTDGRKLDPFFQKLLKPTVLTIVKKRRNQLRKRAK